MHDLLIENGIEIPLAPTYIPEGFTIQELVNEVEDANHQKFHAVFVNKIGNVISISIRTSNPIATVVEKDENDVTIYTTNHVDHYIFFNIDSVSISWCNESFNCSIDIYSSTITEEQIYTMINSIYGNGE